MRTGQKWATRVILTWAFVGALAVLVSCGQLWSAERNEPKTPEMFQATRQAETQLTLVHGAQVRDLIEKHEAQWFSLDAYRDPSIQGELASGRYLDFWGLAGFDVADEASWYVTTSAFARSITVLEYNIQRIKATACVIREVVEILPNEEPVGPLPPRDWCGVYVFSKEDTTWKLVGYFNLLDRRHWEYAQPWLKEIIGDLPESDP